MPKRKRQLHTPMRIQARKGSTAEKQYLTSALPSGVWLKPKKAAIVPGIDQSPIDDLLFHGGKIVPEMEFQNIFLGSAADWKQSDIDKIDAAIGRALQEKRLNNVMAQYFFNVAMSCDQRQLLLLGDPKPVKLDEPDVQEKIKSLLKAGSIKKTNLESTLFNLVLPAGTVLRLGNSSSLNGLGGYHGSVDFALNGVNVTAYYSANVFSQTLPNGTENGIDVFNQPWKNVVGTLYHEINEFRTDANVQKAIEKNDDDFLGWTSRFGQEVGDQPIFVASSLSQVFKEVLAKGKATPVQFMFSNFVHGAEGPIKNPHS